MALTPQLGDTRRTRLSGLGPTLVGTWFPRSEDPRFKLSFKWAELGEDKMNTFLGCGSFPDVWSALGGPANTGKGLGSIYKVQVV